MPSPWIELAVPFAAAALVIFFLWRERIAHYRLLERTTRGTARVRKVHDWIYSAVSGETLARLTLEVRPPSGIPYPLWPVEWYILPTAPVRVTEGLVLDVRIDRQDPHIIYPAVEWARRR